MNFHLGSNLILFSLSFRFGIASEWVEVTVTCISFSNVNGKSFYRKTNKNCSHTYKHTHIINITERRRNLKFKIAESRQWIPKDIYFNLRIFTMWKIQSNTKLSTTIQSRVMISLWYHFICESILSPFFVDFFFFLKKRSQ